MAVKAFTIPSLFEVRFADRAGGCERPHTHSSLIIAAVSKGTVSLQMNSYEICLGKEKVAAIGPHVRHCVCSYSPDFAGVYVLEISSLPTGCEEFDEFHLQAFGSRVYQGKGSYDAFLVLCQTLLGRASVFDKVKVYIDWVYRLFSDRFSGDSPQIPQSYEPNSLANRIRKMLDEEWKEIPSYDDIARSCGCSKEHCNRVFKQTFNLTMQAYFLNQKAAKARELLVSETRLTEISLMCGFYDQSHFTRVFKAIYQISPQKYREAVLETRHSHTRKSDE
ncbi:helix-turn-helix transcriptional regulator [Methylomarinum vadi]|uniref:helix-turn-helix transcriptional regulator n=1 Tax=Methylomarinum vadi TaxID=438855 RepID=UPI001362BD0A|nr:AraC family transcriptional regulator [Methylomarinum vadi]